MIQARSSKNCRLSFQSPDEIANLSASGVSAPRTPAHAARLEMIMMTTVKLPGHPHSLRVISANRLYQNQLDTFFFFIAFYFPF